MAKGPQILTANRLSDGAVLYWTGAGWASPMAEAAIFETPEAAQPALAGAEADRHLVKPYLFAVRLEDGAAVPVKERELVRAAGPTVRRDLGKQAEGLYAPPPVHIQVTHADTTPGAEKDPFDASV